MNALSKTMLIPLWARALETKKPRPLVVDARALSIYETIDFDFSTYRHAYGTQIGCVVRGLLYDQWVGEFLTRYPTGTVVELGAGLSTRVERMDNGQAHWADIDLPDAMAIRKRYLAPSERHTLIEASLTDGRWPAMLKTAASGPYFFVAEGVLMYLPASEVRALFARIAEAFAPTEIAFDSIGSMVVRHQRLHDSMRHMMDAPFRWGIDDIRIIERWDPRWIVRDAATLPAIARRFSSQLAWQHRAIGAVVDRVLPRVAQAYRISRVTLGAGEAT